jgi:hypothetical protein
MRKWIFQAGVVVIAACLLVVGLLAVGNATRQGIRDLDRYTLPFDEIECVPPPNQTRADFLSEVQYLAGLPGKMKLLDDDFPSRLAAAFAGHPWVERVERVEVTSPRQVRVQLTFRKPTLAVRVVASTGGKALSHVVRAVDASGTLLPANAQTQGLPTLALEGTGTPGTAGKPWGVPAVAEAAGIAALLQPHKILTSYTFISTPEGWILQTPNHERVVWGHGAGMESAGEVPAGEKVQRLVRYCSQYGGLEQPGGPFEYDVRPRPQPIRRLVPSTRQ